MLRSRLALKWTLLIVTCAHNAAAYIKDCPLGMTKAEMEAFLVEHDPSQFLHGPFLEVFFSPGRNPPICAGTTYTPGAHAKITAKSIEKFGARDDPSPISIETLTKLYKKGVYQVKGVYERGINGGERYDGKLYVFHADENVIGYYYCRLFNKNELKNYIFVTGGACHAVVSVKKDMINELMQGTEVGLRESVDKAKEKLRSISSETRVVHDSVEPSYTAYEVDEPVEQDQFHIYC